MSKRYRAPKTPTPLAGQSPKAPAGTPGYRIRIKHRECVPVRAADRKKLRQHTYAVVLYRGTAPVRVIGATDDETTAEQIAMATGQSLSRCDDVAEILGFSRCCRKTRPRKPRKVSSKPKKVAVPTAQENHARSVDVDGKCMACGDAASARVRNARCVAAPVSKAVKALREELSTVD